VAVNVVEAPEHCGFVPDVIAIETEEVTGEFTPIEILFEETLNNVPVFIVKVMFGLLEVVVPVVTVQAPAPDTPLA